MSNLTPALEQLLGALRRRKTGADAGQAGLLITQTATQRSLVCYFFNSY
ncbi:hypothetical protein BLL52_2634 [Rhodoferax antarcticus ANT.BR]|uniref:Uncharacterized protein n=1 Tax=Rhodoferax antarcticus ANT.BR TaxID=1111071 RepID=A0A1Q8YED5_9BURK|nr:hypothetical protein BLL52_2634 [Rhodoferax antarcticus ANT.BR]